MTHCCDSVCWIFTSMILVSPVFAMAAESSSASELATMRQRFVNFILPSDPQAGRPIVEIASRYAKTLADDGSWPDIDYKDTDRAFWKAEQHLERTLLLAKAVRLDHPELAEPTIKSLQWWCGHDLKNSNWWFNEIGIPQLMGEIGVLMGERITDPGTGAKMIEIMKRGDWSTRTGQNLVWMTSNQVLRGLIEDSPEPIEQAYKRMYEEIRIEPLGKEGIQADFSFHQHGSQFYSGGYGLGFANDVTRFVALSWGTRFQIPPEKMKIFESYLLDGQQWMIRGQVFDYSAVGRELTRAGKRAVIRDWERGPISPAGAAYGLENAMTVLSKLGTPRQSEIAEFAARLRGDSGAKPQAGNKHFWCSDYMSHQRPDFMVSIRMFSSRLINTEIVNNEGRRSHHLADGATYIYRGGDEYHDIFPVWDWAKVPGTTAIQTPVDQLDAKENVKVKGATDFVGGVSDGQVGLAAMDLKRGPLVAKKAWLCLDDVVICLGAGITCSDPQVDVATCVNQCLRRGEVVQSADHKSVRHDGVGYLFDDPSSVKLVTEARSGKWSDIGAGSSETISKDVMLLYIDHGRSPREATYQYMLAFADRQQPQVKIVSNTAQLQAAMSDDVLGIAFWAAGQLDGGADFGKVEVDQPCLVLLRKSTGKVAVSNPRNRPMRINVRIGGKPIPVDLHDGASVVVSR